MLAPLAEALQQNPAGSAAHAAAVQSAVSSLGAGRDSRGSLYRAGRVAEGARPRTPGIRCALQLLSWPRNGTACDGLGLGS